MRISHLSSEHSPDKIDKDIATAKKPKDGMITDRKEFEISPKERNKEHKLKLEAQYYHVRQASMDPRVRFLDQWSDDQLMYYPVGKGIGLFSDNDAQVMSGAVSLCDNNFKACENLLEYQP